MVDGRRVDWEKRAGYIRTPCPAPSWLGGNMVFGRPWEGTDIFQSQACCNEKAQLGFIDRSVL